MGRFRGFLLKNRVTTIFRCVFRRRCSPAGYRRLDSVGYHGSRSISRLFSWTWRLRTKAKAMLCSKKMVTLGSGSGGYLKIAMDPVQDRPVPVPKGQMAVYVGREDGDFKRVLVPVVYFNHPLFGELLREAENEYGFDHPGGITLPCRISEFERVQTQIKKGPDRRKMSTRKGGLVGYSLD